MSLTVEQCDLIQTSWTLLTNQHMVAWNFTETFYNTVFSISPSCKVLFQNDMKSQGEALVGMLATVVKNIKELATIKQAVIDLGVRHKHYGVKKNMYLVVGRALIQTLHDLLGEAVTLDIKLAWMDAYSVLASIMIKASGHKMSVELIRSIIDPAYVSVDAFTFIVSNNDTLKAFNNKMGNELEVNEKTEEKRRKSLSRSDAKMRPRSNSRSMKVN
eukprot:Awhi_evm1s12283